MVSLCHNRPKSFSVAITKWYIGGNMKETGIQRREKCKSSAHICNWRAENEKVLTYCFHNFVKLEKSIKIVVSDVYSGHMTRRKVIQKQACVEFCSFVYYAVYFYLLLQILIKYYKTCFIDLMHVTYY